MATVYIGGASIDENGKAHGGKAGNQTGKELRKQKWYLHSKGWRVFRAKSVATQAKLAASMAAAVANAHIGYDQYERNTLYNEAAKVGFDVSRVTKDVECDCSALVRVCCAYAGIAGLPEGFRTTNEPANLLKTGLFSEMTGDRYQKKADYLRAGDILCTPVQGHTVIVLNDGDKAGTEAAGELRRGDKGAEVAAMQAMLMKWKADCLPKWGADGDFGGETEAALTAFQKAAGLAASGIYDAATKQALTGAQGAGEERDPSKDAGAGRMIEITGGSVNVRNAPGVEGTRVLGVAYRGDALAYLGETREAGGRPWYRVAWGEGGGWVSSLYARLA